MRKTNSFESSVCCCREHRVWRLGSRRRNAHPQPLASALQKETQEWGGHIEKRLLSGTVSEAGHPSEVLLSGNTVHLSHGRCSLEKRARPPLVHRVSQLSNPTWSQPLCDQPQTWARRGFPRASPAAPVPHRWALGCHMPAALSYGTCRLVTCLASAHYEDMLLTNFHSHDLPGLRGSDSRLGPFVRLDFTTF